MDFLPPVIEAYALAHTSAESPLLTQLNRETHAKILQSRMLSGQMQGRLLALFSTMMRPRRILEIGTYTGYSALCLAEGLTEEGVLITIDVNEELEEVVKTHVEKAGLQHKIIQIIGDATSEINNLNETFDIVFIDADKQNYSLYYDLVIDKVRTGGFILADNVLWSGKIIDEKKDKDTQKLAEFNDKVQQDNRVDNVIVSMRDGIMMMRKK